MIRGLTNVLILAIAALHAVVVPIHVATEHVHDALAHEAQANTAHSHDHDHGHPHVHHEPADNIHADSAGGHVQLAHHSEFPHHHSEHDHNIADHGQYRSRVDNPFINIPATVPVLACLADGDDSYLPIESFELPPIQAPCLNAVSLRGPPFC